MQPQAVPGEGHLPDRFEIAIEHADTLQGMPHRLAAGALQNAQSVLMQQQEAFERQAGTDPHRFQPPPPRRDGSEDGERATPHDDDIGLPHDP